MHTGIQRRAAGIHAGGAVFSDGEGGVPDAKKPDVIGKDIGANPQLGAAIELVLPHHRALLQHLPVAGPECFLHCRFKRCNRDLGGFAAIDVDNMHLRLRGHIQRDYGTAIVLFTHDMGAISEMADRVAVINTGRVIGETRADDVLGYPQHSYARGSISCIPALGKEDGSTRDLLAEIPGVVPPLHMLGRAASLLIRASQSAP